jgi:hypothetical protein
MKGYNELVSESYNGTYEEAIDNNLSLEVVEALRQ